MEGEIFDQDMDERLAQFGKSGRRSFTILKFETSWMEIFQEKDPSTETLHRRLRSSQSQSGPLRLIDAQLANGFDVETDRPNELVDCEKIDHPDFGGK
jgi:hypothetical protein